VILVILDRLNPGAGRLIQIRGTVTRKLKVEHDDRGDYEYRQASYVRASRTHSSAKFNLDRKLERPDPPNTRQPPWSSFFGIPPEVVTSESVLIFIDFPIL